MPETTVIHVRDYDPSRGDIYIGRRFHRGRYHFDASPWANPFRRGDHHPGSGSVLETNQYLVSAFTWWVLTSDDPRAVWIREHTHELREKRLACWCFPKPCHGEVLAAMAEEGANEG